VGGERHGRWGSWGGVDIAATGRWRRCAESDWALPGGVPRVDVEGGEDMMVAVKNGGQESGWGKPEAVSWRCKPHSRR